MKVCLLALLLAFACVGAASAQQVVRGRPPHTLFAPLRAVDHVASIVRAPTGGAGPVEGVVARSGDWQREEFRTADGVSVRFANFATGASFLWFRAADRPREEFSAVRESPENDHLAYTLTDTGRRETRLGETCSVWAWSKIERTSVELTWLSCVTRDGVELWQGWEHNGEITEHFHTVRVERRPLRRAEVRLPPELLDWSYWRATPPNGRGYEVDLRSDIGGEHVRRGAADWLYVDSRYDDGGRAVAVRQPLGRMTYSHDGQGSLYLSIDRFAAPQPQEQAQPMPNRASEVIAGEECSWFDTMPGVFDVYHAECRTPDGVALADAAGGEVGPHVSARATRVRRGILAADAFEPPPEVLSVWRRRR